MSFLMTGDADAVEIVSCINELLPEAGPPPPGAERLALQIGEETFLYSPPGRASESGHLVPKPVGGQARSVDCTVVFRSAAVCCAVARGELTPQQAFTSGQVQVRGRLSALLVMKPYLEKLGERYMRPDLSERGGSFASDGNWLPNAASASCMSCKQRFTFLRRRHHCRSCGKLFCGQCSPKRFGGPRTCEVCSRAKLDPVVPGSGRCESHALEQHLRAMELRLEVIEASAASREADDYLTNASVLFGASVCAAVAAASMVGVKKHIIVAVFAAFFICLRLLWRHLRAFWLTLLIVWKLLMTRSEVARLCDADAQKLRSARYRAVACLGARGLRELGGVWPKVGQYLSTQGDQWPDEVLVELSKLRDSMPAAPLKVTRRTIEQDLRRPLGEIFQSFAEKPIASASIGQVHRATLKDGREVAVKVQHRHAARQIPVDVACMRMIARLVWVLTRGEIDAMPVITEWLGAVMEELDFENEARSQMRGRTELETAGVDVIVPEIFPSLCGRRVLVMEFIEGEQITAGSTSLTADERLRVMSDLVRAYAHGLFVSGHFNGDPHAGNLLVTRREERAQCVLLDWGLTKTLREERRLAACELMVATGMKDTCGIVQAFTRMGLNFSASADPEPEMLLMILRHISLIDKQSESRKITQQAGEAIEKACKNSMDLHTKIDSYTGDFFFIFRVATLIKGLSAILDIRAHFLDIFVSTSRDALRGSPSSTRLDAGCTLALPWRSSREARVIKAAEEAISRGDAVGVQVAVVSADGEVLLSVACGHVAYTSWQRLQVDDCFPLGAPWLARPLIAAASLNALRARGFEAKADATRVWPTFLGPRGTSMARVAEGGLPTDLMETYARPPPKPCTRLMGDIEGLTAWLEKAPRLDANAAVPPWWPPASHAASNALLLKAAGAGTLGAALRGLFAEASGQELLAAADGSSVQISKPVMSVESAEVVASQDALLAAVGNEELRCIHLTDVCLANHEALRQSRDLPCGMAASARGLALTCAHAHRRGLVHPRLLNAVGDLGCISRCSSGHVVVVLLTCANSGLAQQLAHLSLQ